MIEDFEADVTPKLVTHMAGELKGCQFLLETGASHYLDELLDSRNLDMVVAAQLNMGYDWIEVHPLLRDKFVVATPKALLTRRGMFFGS